MRQLRKLSGILIPVLLIVFIPHTCQARARRHTAKRHLMRVTFVDVGQGDCEFIQTPGGKTILIDAGPGATEYDNFDAGKKIVVPYLKSLKIKKIDYMVMSHAHNDHIGGMRAVINNFPVGTFVDPGFDYPSWVYEDLLKLVSKKKIKYIEAHAGDVFKWDKYLKIEVFNPPQKYFRGGSEANENSIILKITYNKISFLFTGDAERRAERYAVKHFKDDLMCTFLKVAHHGSATSTSQEFLDWSQPLFAVIEVGQGNRWGHPKREVLERLKEYGCQIYRTDRNGFVEVITDGVKYKLRHFDFWSKESNYGEGYE